MDCVRSSANDQYMRLYNKDKEAGKIELVKTNEYNKNRIFNATNSF